MYREIPEKSSNFTSLASSKIISDKDFRQLRTLLEKLKAKHKESANELINRIETVPIIPLSIFNEKLSTLETIVKYAKENLGLSYAKIARLLNRSQKTIWQAHYFAKKKFPKKLIVTDSRFNVPITIFSNRILSTLESIVFYLKEKYKLRNSEIAKLLKRNSRTVWTVYSRAKKKCSINKITISDFEKEIKTKKEFEDKDFKKLAELITRLKQKYGLSSYEIISLVEIMPLIPLTIFTKKLSALETIVKYAKENLGLKYKEIAKWLNRSDKTIWQAHSFAKKKLPEKFVVLPSKYNIPITIFSDRRLSILESLVKYLKEEFKLTNHEIALLLKRSDRTVWTVYTRAKAKQHGFGKTQ